MLCAACVCPVGFYPLGLPFTDGMMALFSAKVGRAAVVPLLLAAERLPAHRFIYDGLEDRKTSRFSYFAIDQLTTQTHTEPESWRLNANTRYNTHTEESNLFRSNCQHRMTCPHLHPLERPLRCLALGLVDGAVAAPSLGDAAVALAAKNADKGRNKALYKSTKTQLFGVAASAIANSPTTPPVPPSRPSRPRL